MENDKAKKVENYLNQYKIDDQVPAGSLIAMAIVYDKQPLNLIYILKFLIRIFGFIKVDRKVYKNCSLKKRSCRDIFVSLASSNYRLFSFVEGLWKSDYFNTYLTVPKNDFESNNFKTYKVFFLPWSNVFKLGKAVFKIPDLKWWERIISLNHLIIQIKQYSLAKTILSDIKPKLILADLDRYPTNVPFILAARKFSISTITLIHGSTNPIDNYIPVLADHLFAWGEYHRRVFKEQLKQEVQVHVVGNPKIKKFREQKQFPTPKNNLIVGWATSEHKDEVQEKLMGIFLQGTRGVYKKLIKPHPRENIERYKETLEAFEDVTISDQSPDDFLKEIDLLCVRNSQIGSDTLAYNIPIIVIDGFNGWNLQNGEALHNFANCPAMNNSKELQIEIQQLTKDSRYLSKRLNDQKIYYYNLYRYQGKESVKKMEEKIKLIIN
jgi:hypothetical protein